MLPIVVETEILYIVGCILALFFLYIIRIHIAYRMAKKRARRPLGWVLLSLFVSPILTWIILLIVGKDERAYNEYCIDDKYNQVDEKDL